MLGDNNVKACSRHTSRGFVSVDSQCDSRHITCLSHLQTFVANMANNTKCCRRDQDGYLCEGTYKISKVVKKGIGGALQAQAICSGCKFVIVYGNINFSPSSSSRPTQMSIGHTLLLSYMLVGRPLYTAYKKMFGSIGMDFYSSKTFQKFIVKLAAAIDEQQNFEVGTHSLTHCCMSVCVSDCHPP